MFIFRVAVKENISSKEHMKRANVGCFGGMQTANGL